MGKKKKQRGLRKASRSSPKRAARTRKPVKKKAAPSKGAAGKKKKKAPAKPAARRKATPSKGMVRKKKAAPSKAKRAAAGRKPVARRKATAPKKVAFSKVLKREISTMLVTGATGCVGSLLVQRLLRDGYSVIAVDRKGREPPPFPETGALVFKQGDLSNPGFAVSCLEGVDAIFHPGRHADGKPLYGGREPSPVGATRILYQKARERGVKRFILITSASLYGPHHGPISEEGEIEARDEYEQSQIELESILLEDRLPGLPSVTIIRSAAVYGPGCTASMACLATLPPLVKTLGPYYIPLSGGPRMNLVHGEDVARSAVFLLLLPKAYGAVFNVADNDPMPFGRFINTAMESYGLKPLGPGVPYPPSTLLQSILPCMQEEEIFNPLGKLNNLLWERIVRSHRLSKTLIPPVDAEAHPVGSRDLVVDNRKLLGLGFRLKYPRFGRGWEQTLTWYLKNRWIPRANEL